MRCYQVMNLLLTFCDSTLVSRSKFFFNIEWIKMAVMSCKYNTDETQKEGNVLECLAEDTALPLDSRLPAFCYLNKNSRLHLRVLFDNSHPKRNTEFDCRFAERSERDTN